MSFYSDMATERMLIKAFMEHGACTPAQAIHVTELGVGPEHEAFADLVEKGVIHTEDDRHYWIDEAVARRVLRRRVILLFTLWGIGLAIGTFFVVMDILSKQG